jgi:23S rRNA (cytidine2498-2'-O)-methyltransferase
LETDMPTAPSVPSTNRYLARPRENVPAADSSRPQVGEWLWACRVGAEVDLCEELAELRVAARALQPGLVASVKRPQEELVFARQGFPVKGVCKATVEALTPLLSATLKRPFALQIFAADSEAGTRLSAIATTLAAELTQTLTARRLRVCADGTAAHAEGALLAQVCLLDAETAVYGEQSATSAPSLFAGGVHRVRRPRGAPSRSAHKLAEALAWLANGPDSNDECIDLGAAPGGWSGVLADRNCKVIAVDPGALAPAIARQVRHIRTNAFEYVPETPADWLFCDMAYRPLEVASLLARWGRHRWARFLIANIKLPMKKRVAMLRRVREILASGGWTGLRGRQLYHDREEVTLFAWRGFGIDTRVPTRKKDPAAPHANRSSSQSEPAARKSPSPGRRPPPDRSDGARSREASAERPTRGGQRPRRADDKPRSGASRRAPTSQRPKSPSPAGKSRPARPKSGPGGRPGKGSRPVR